MTREQCLRLVDALNADPQMRELLARPDPTCPDSATLAGLGVPYTLAGQPVPAPSPAAVAVLSLIGSPLLDGAEEIDAMDAWRALWAVTAQPADLSCLYGLDARVETIRRGCLKARVKPEDAVAMMAQATAAAYAPVDRAAVALSARYPGASAQDVADLVRSMLGDVTAAWGRLPKGKADNPDPTRAGHASTATGSRTWRTGLGWLASAWRRLTSGRFPRRGLGSRLPAG